MEPGAGASAMTGGRVAALALAVLQRLARYAQEARRVESLPHERAERTRDHLRDLEGERSPVRAIA